MVLGGNAYENYERKTTKEVDLISLNKDVPVPECLQKMEPITFMAKFPAGARTSLGKSG